MVRAARHGEHFDPHGINSTAPPDGLRAMLWDAGVKTAYSDVRRIVADGVVTEQHIVTLTRADGFSASADVCAVIRFDDNRFITRIDEYFDSAAFGPLLS